MTVPVATSRVDYVGNGVATAFVTPFVFFAAGDLVVKLILISTGVATTQVFGVNYTVAGGSGATGTVNMIVAPSNLYKLRIERTVPLTQATSFSNQGAFDPKIHEQQFDLVTEEIQQLDRRLSDVEANGSTTTGIVGDGLQVAAGVWSVKAGSAAVSVGPGGVDLAFGVPTANVNRSAASGGAAAAGSRADHKHDIDIAAPSALTVGAAAVTGVGPELAAKDHQHVCATQAPIAVDAAAAVIGATGKFSDAGHKHVVSTGAVSTLGTVNAAGAGPALALNDHVHAHGAQTDGTLHAIATAAVNGFLSAADKAKLDGLSSENVSASRVTTNDATPTTITSWTQTDNSTEYVEVSISGMKSTNLVGGGYKRAASFRRKDGVVTQVGATTLVATHEDDATWDVDFLVASPVVNVRVTGVAATTINWEAVVRRVSAP